MIVDTVLTYQFIKKLTTPFNLMPGYKLHLIDDKGNFLKARKDYTSQDTAALGLFDVMIINLKKLIAKIPGGSSRLGTIAAAMVLLNAKPIREGTGDGLEDLEEQFNYYLSQVSSLDEDGAVGGAVAVNSAGSGDIAGIGQPPGSAKGFPPVSAKNKYKRNNELETKKIQRGVLGAVKFKESGPEGGFAGDNVNNAKPSKNMDSIVYKNKNTSNKKVIKEVESHDIEKTFRDDYKDKNNKSETKLNKITKSFKKFSRFKEETTLEYHDILNQKIWDGASLRGEVRGKLMQIADAWRDFAKIHPETVTDVILTGGNANYNYTNQSDLDLHLIINRGEFNNSAIDRAFVDEYLQDKKILWTLTHGDINIYGYPVELYAQDIHEEPHSGQGVYSVRYNHWIQSPEYLNLNFESDPNLQDKVDFYKDMIDKLVDQQADSDSIDTLKDRIKSMRGDSIAQGGEFAFGNLVFKELRNSGYLDKISNYEKTTKDKSLSLG